MNRKLVLGAVAGVAAIGLAVGGTTYAAYSDFGTVSGNSVAAGILKLDLKSGDGGAAAPLNFGPLAPGHSAFSAVYIASSDGASVPAADLYVTLNGVKDFENGCSSASESVNDPSCASADQNSSKKSIRNADDGTQGELSKVLDVRVKSYASTDPAQCKGYAGANTGTGALLHDNVLPTNEQGTLADPKNLDTGFLISDANAPLTQGQGVCLVFFTYWPTTGSNALDNAAQGDSLSFDARFDLVQNTTSTLNPPQPAPATLDTSRI